MIQTYQGYFQADGRFIPDSRLAQIPIMRRAIVNVFDEEISEKPDSQKQREALIKFSAGLSKISDEPLDETFDAVINERFNIGREMDL